MNTIEAVYAVGQQLGAAPAPVATERLAEQRELIRAVKALNGAELFGQNNELRFVLDRETHRPVLRIVNRTTNELIRQIPPEYVLELARDLRDPQSAG